MKYFKVKTGYDVNDFISVDETELASAIRAQVTGKVAIFNAGTVSGNNIIGIVPDFNRLMGWNRGYVMTGEDYNEIGSNTAESYTKLFENTKNEVLKLSGKPVQVGPSDSVKLLAEKMRA